MDNNEFENVDRSMKDSYIIKRTWQYIKPYWKRLLLASILMIAMIVLQLVNPLFTKQIIDIITIKYVEGTTDVIIPMTQENLNWVFIWSAIYFACVLGNAVLLYINTMLLQHLGQDVIYDLRMTVFEHIDSLSVNQLNNIPVGSLVTRLTSDTNQLSDLFTNTIVNLLKNFLLLVGTLGFMFYMNWVLALYISIYIPLIFAITFIFRKYLRKNYRIVRKNFSIMNAFLNENISGMKITQIFNQESRKINEFDKLNKNIIESRQKDIRIFSVFRPLISLLYFSAVALTFFVGVQYALAGVMTIGAVYAFYQYVSNMFNPIQELADQFNSLQRAFTSCERLYTLLDTKPEVLDRDDAIEIDHFEGKIEFKHVWFAYKDENWILKDVSFTVEPKQVVAFVGATGAGKTTILQLIVRNYEVQKGEILIDGINVKNIKMSSLHKAFGQMLQDVFLFSGTIASNIALRDEDISRDEIIEASKYVNAHDFIMKQEHGYDEEVQERGENFSSGQRQLLSFARTIVHKPQILILDEATANIDTETEQVIQQSLLKMMSIGTMLIVAHRLSTIQHADNIICLQHGELIEQGNHQQLLKKHGYYYNLYRLQYEDQENSK
jgi:ATP-binding cassette subfamily B protein